MKRNHNQSTVKDDLAAARKRLKAFEDKFDNEKRRCRAAEKALQDKKNELVRTCVSVSGAFEFPIFKT